MTVRLKEIDNIILIRLEGEFTLEFIPNFIDIINNLLNKKKEKILISLEKVTKIDSSGLGAIIATTSTLEQNGASLKILHLSPQAKRVFDFNNIQDYIEVYSNSSLAITAFSKRSL
jgi:anti-anti-sigma factor